MIKKLSSFTIVLLITTIFLMPPIKVVLSSVMSAKELSQIYLKEKIFHWHPSELSIDGYDTLLFSSSAFLSTFWLTLFSAFCAASLQVVISMIVGYELSCLHTCLGKWLIGIYGLMMMIPFQVVLLPTYLITIKLNIYNTIWSVILPQVFAPLGAVFVCRYLLYLSHEIIEAAILETSSLTCIYFRIISPCIIPCLLTVFLISFAETWNAFEQPLVLIEDRSRQLMSVQLYHLTDKALNIRFAGAVMYLLPVIIIYTVSKEHLLQCLEHCCPGGIK